MATASEQLLNDLMAVPWDYLAGKTAYTDLGLKEFRLYNGRKLPVRNDGSLSNQDVPAIYCELILPRLDTQEATPRIDVVEVECSMGIVYPENRTGTYAMTAAAAALLTIQDLIGTRTAIRTNMGGGSAIDEYDYQIGEVTPVTSEVNPQVVVYWDARFSWTLRKRRAMPEV